MRILFLGDIVGQSGWRETLGSILIILGGVIEVVYVPKSEKKLA